MKLYYAPGACSLSPHIALQEAGLDFEAVQVDLQAKKTKAGADFLKINPKGQVPTLELDDGSQITEGTAIVQYIADQAPESGLAPAPGGLPRVRLQEWLNYIATELHKGFGPLWKPDTPDDYKPIVHRNLAQRFDHLDQHLAGQPYLMGDSFTVADAYAFTIVNWANFHDIDLAKWSNVTAYMARVAARPKVQETLKAEGLI